MAKELKAVQGTSSLEAPMDNFAKEHLYGCIEDLTKHCHK